MKFTIVLILFAFSMLFILPTSFSETLEPTFTFENKIYTVNDIITISGNGDRIEGVIRGEIKNPDNNLVAYINISTDSNANFFHELDLSTLGTFGQTTYPEYIINGTYTIKIKSFGEHPPIEKEYTFEFFHIVPSGEITFSLDKKLYEKNDIIILTGEAPEILVMKKLKVHLIDPYGEPVINNYNNYPLIFNLAVDENNKFDIRIFTKDFLVNGNYTIEVNGEYIDKIITTKQQFQYDNPYLVDVKALDNQVQTIDNTVTQLDTDVTALDTEINELRSDTDTLQSDTNTLRNDTDTLRSDVDSLQTQFDNFEKFVNEQLRIIFDMFS